MADFNAFKITDGGRALLASIIGTEGDKIAFTKFVTSDEEIDYSTAETITSLKSPKQTKPVDSADYIPPDAVKLKALINSDGLQTGYYVRTLALYAQSEQKQQEIIFAITTQKNQAKADWMSPAGSISQSTIQIIANILIMDAEVASVTIIPDGTVSEEVFNDHVQNESLGVHGSTVEATPSKLIIRDELGYSKIKSPNYEEAEDEHIMNKKSVTEALSNKLINIYDSSKTYKTGDIVAIEKEIEVGDNYGNAVVVPPVTGTEDDIHESGEKEPDNLVAVLNLSEPEIYGSFVRFAVSGYNDNNIKDNFTFFPDVSTGAELKKKLSNYERVNNSKLKFKAPNFPLSIQSCCIYSYLPKNHLNLDITIQSENTNVIGIAEDINNMVTTDCYIEIYPKAELATCSLQEISTIQQIEIYRI